VNGHYESFTVRVWASGGRIVRGEVVHVPSGESERFVDPGDVSRFLARQVAAGSADHEGHPGAISERLRPAEPTSGGASAPEGGATRHDISNHRSGAR
jgi:hypothetical protein